MKQDAEMNVSDYVSIPNFYASKIFYGTVGDKIWLAYYDETNTNNGYVSLLKGAPTATSIFGTFEEGQNAIYDTDDSKCLSLATIETMMNNSLQLLRNCDI